MQAVRQHVLLELGDVVGDVVNQLHPELFPRLAEEPREDLARLVSQELAVAPGIVGRRAHRAQVRLPLRAPHRGTGELPVGQLESVPLRGVLEGREVVVAHLVAQPARAGVDQDGDLPFVKTHDFGRGRVEDAVDDLDFEEMVAGAERAALVETARDRAIADPPRIGALQAARPPR